MTTVHSHDSTVNMQAHPIFELMRRAAVPGLCLLVALYFGSHALFGGSGIFALDDIRREQARIEASNVTLEARKRSLQQSIALLDPNGVDPDYADELVRRQLGVVRPDEVIVPLTPPAGRSNG